MAEPQPPEHHHLHEYAGGEILEHTDKPYPKFLYYVYVILPIWGVYCLYSYWGGTQGALDRGHWQELQNAAFTTLKSTNREDLKQQEEAKALEEAHKDVKSHPLTP